MISTALKNFSHSFNMRWKVLDIQNDILHYFLHVADARESIITASVMFISCWDQSHNISLEAKCTPGCEKGCKFGTVIVQRNLPISVARVQCCKISWSRREGSHCFARASCWVRRPLYALVQARQIHCDPRLSWSFLRHDHKRMTPCELFTGWNLLYNALFFHVFQLGLNWLTPLKGDVSCTLMTAGNGIFHDVYMHWGTIHCLERAITKDLCELLKQSFLDPFYLSEWVKVLMCWGAVRFFPQCQECWLQVITDRYLSWASHLEVGPALCSCEYSAAEFADPWERGWMLHVKT